MLASASSATGIKSTSVFLYSEGLGVLCRYCAASAQAWSATVWTQRLENIHLQQQAITEMCSATPRTPVCLCAHCSLNYTEGDVWSGEVCAGENWLCQHKWFICADLKMVNFLLGQQSGFTKYPYFLFIWDSRDHAQHYTKKDWPLREELVPCKERKVINDPLVDRDWILFPPLHIMLGLIK